MSNLEPEEALRMYLQRMKIDATFRDLKDLLGLERRMNRSQEYMEKMVALLYRAPRGGESEGFPVRAAAFGVEGTRRVSRPAGASQPGSPGHPFPGARESSGPAPAKPVALLRSVRTPHAEVVRDASAVAGHRPGGSGFLPGYPLSSCPNSCPNLSHYQVDKLDVVVGADIAVDVRGQDLKADAAKDVVVIVQTLKGPSRRGAGTAG
jgi:hypothetical protein